MMEELPSSRDNQEILEEADATAEGGAVEVHAGAMRPLSQPSEKKGALHVPIETEKISASTVEKKDTGQTCAPSYLKSNSHRSI